MKSSKAIYRTLARRYLQSRKTLLFACLIAIVITSVFFVSILTVITSIQRSQQELAFENHGKNHLFFINFHETDLLQILGHADVAHGTYELFLGDIANPEFENLAMSPMLQYNTQANLTERYRVSFIAGGMPQNYLEVVTSTQVLDILGIPQTVGAEVPITYTHQESHQEVTETFILSGYYEPTELLYDIERVSVSEAYKAKNFTNPKGEAAVSLVHPKKIKNQGSAIITSLGLQQSSGFTEKNPAYNSLNLADLQISTVFAIILFILFVLYTGYILINNIFTIFVRFDIELYSQLKCLGATNAQIKTLLRMQLMYLSIVGIPLGLLAGYLVSGILLPAVASTLNSVFIDTHILVYIGTALFVFLCLLLSTRAPVKFCKTISPVLLLSSISSQTRKILYGRKRKTRISLWNLAKIETLSNKKKLTKVVASLAFMPIVLLGITTFVQSIDANKLVQGFTPSDFLLADSDYFMGGSMNPSFLNGAIIEEVEQHIPVTASSPIYFTQGSMRIYTDFLEQDPDTNFSGNYTKLDTHTFTAYYNHTEYEVDLYSMTDFLLESYEVIDGELDIDKFNQGGYLIEIVSGNAELPTEPIDLYYANNFLDSYNIMAKVQSRPATENRVYFGSFVKKFIMPIKEYTSITQVSDTNNHILSYCFNVSADNYNKAEAYLINLSENNPKIMFQSPKSYMENLEQDQSIYSVAGFFLALLFGLIGLVNLASTTIVSIYSRKEQFMNLRKIGMSKKQLNVTLWYESALYLIGTILTFGVLGAITVGGLLRMVILRGDFASFQLHIIPSVVVLALYAVCSIFFSTMALNSMFKEQHKEN